MGQRIQSVRFSAILCLLLPIGGRVAPAQTAHAARNSAGEEKSLLQAATREPNNLQAVGSLGEYYLRNEKWHESARWLAKAYALSSGDETVGYELAYATMQAGDLDGAKRQIERTLAQTDNARLDNLLGEVDDRRGDYVTAAREYHRAAEIDPSESNIFDLATFLLQHQKYVGFLDDSIKFFRYGWRSFRIHRA